MQIITLITALPGAVAQGLIWGIMAIGVYITFRILDIADLTVDGTMCTQASHKRRRRIELEFFTPLWEFPQSLPES